MVISPAFTIIDLSIPILLTDILPIRQAIISPFGVILPRTTVPLMPIVAVFVFKIKFLGAICPIRPVIDLNRPRAKLNFTFGFFGVFKYSSILKALFGPNVTTVLSLNFI